MKYGLRHSRHFHVSLSAAALLVSCATADDGHGDGTRPTDTSHVPDPGPDAGIDADASLPVDGGCDPSDPSCVTGPVTCEQASWCPVHTGVPALYALTTVWGASKNDVWAGGSGGTIVHWDGTAWLPAPPSAIGPVKDTFRALWGSGPSDVWIASAADMVFHTNGFANGTAIWTRMPNAAGDAFNTTPIYAAWGASAGEIRFGGQAYVLYTPTGGMDWINQMIAKRAGSSGEMNWGGEFGTATIKGMWGSSADDLWLVGDNSDAVSWQLGWTAHGTRTKNGGFVWTAIDSQAGVAFEAVWGSSAGDVWAVGDKGTIRHIGAGGSAWEVVPSPTKAPLHAIWGSSERDVWAVGDGGTILHWDGSEWTPSIAAFAADGKRPPLYGIWGSSADDVWIVGDGVALHHSGGAK